MKLIIILAAALGLVPAPVKHTPEKDGTSFKEAVAQLEPWQQEEAYRITFYEKRIKVEALTPQGRFRAQKTLEQLELLGESFRVFLRGIAAVVERNDAVFAAPCKHFVDQLARRVTDDASVTVRRGMLGRQHPQGGLFSSRGTQRRKQCGRRKRGVTVEHQYQALR